MSDGLTATADGEAAARTARTAGVATTTAATGAAAPTPGRQAGVVPVLAALTFASGMLDAASYLGLGHVFTANMTGNVVILGFAAAGAPGFSAAASAVSLAAFLFGAAGGGRLASRHADRPRRWMLTAVLVEVVALTVAAVLGAVAGIRVGDWTGYTVTAVLAMAMGCRNATVRRLAVPDLTTTVLTLTLTGLAADARPGGQDRRQAVRRAGVAALMLAGAATGTWLLRTFGLPGCLGVAAVWALGSASLLRARHATI
ncbi:YoaK family protein [Kitasatospora sp. NPDC052896]|uniref:YoaK family protein n=1 Tax=Kitasatospora sp. NPDC052896 TaxID=3364061 RepID=UPI0037C7039D